MHLHVSWKKRNLNWKLFKQNTITANNNGDNNNEELNWKNFKKLMITRTETCINEFSKKYYN